MLNPTKLLQGDESWLMSWPCRHVTSLSFLHVDCSFVCVDSSRNCFHTAHASLRYCALTCVHSACNPLFLEQREKLAEAETKERAAERAAAEAAGAEALAVEKHKEAARDEREAAERRLAARRAHEIAAIGAGDVTGLDKFASEHSLSTADVSAD
jgi:hypothetical protein